MERPVRRLSPASILFFAMLGLIAAEALLFGAARPGTAVIFAAGAAAICLAGVASPRGRARLSALPFRPLLPAAAWFLALAAWIAWGLSPSFLAAPEWRDIGHGGVAIDRLGGLQQLVILGGLACVFVVGLMQGGRKHGARTAIYLVAGAVGAYGLWAMAEFFLHPGMLLGAPKTYHQDRLSGSFLSANTAASLFGATAALSMARLGQSFAAGDWRRKKGVLNTAFWALFLAVCLAALLLAASRGGLIATLLVCLIAAAFWFGRSIRRGDLALAGGAVVAAGLLAWFAWNFVAESEAAARFSVSNEGLLGRVSLFTHFAAIAGERPWQGFGLGGFEPAMLARLSPHTFAEFGQIRAAHNLALQWLIEGGVIGALLMSGCVAGVLAVMCRRLRSSGPVLAFSAVLILHGMSDYALQVPAIAAIWALLLGVSTGAALRSLGRRAQQQRRREPALDVGDTAWVQGVGHARPAPES